MTPVSDSELQIHCHGGTAPINAILASLESIGFVIGLNSRKTMAQASGLETELQSGLWNARTTKIAEYFLHLAKGTLVRQVDRLIELENIPRLLAELEALSQSFQVGQFLARPISTVLAGRPNAGKSSLNNQVLGYSRSIVLDQPGTTRDILCETTTIEGWAFEFSDTAGIRNPSDAVETAGVEFAKNRLQLADIVLHVVSLEHGLDQAIAELDHEDFNFPGVQQALLTVFNKADLLDINEKKTVEREFPEVLLTDALRGMGIDRLLARLKNLSVPEDPPFDQPPLFTVRQKELVDRAILATRRGQQKSAVNYLVQLKSSP
ncbi:MAG: GTPase [Planctomycetota bacterium]|nr:GTPase [Planctomycetota bacterium]